MKAVAMPCVAGIWMVVS